MGDKSPTKADKNTFSTREQEIMSLAWQCFEGEPKVDYKKLAALCNMTNPVSASNAWARIKKKLAAQAAEAGGAASAAANGAGEAGTPKAATPKATPASKRKKGVEGDDEEGTPSKKPRDKGKKSKVEVEDGDGDGDEGGSPVKREVDEED